MVIMMFVTVSAMVAMITTMVAMIRITAPTSAFPAAPENATGGSDQDEGTG